MQNGWIKLHRVMTEWEWYDDPKVKIVFLHLLLTVNHEKKKWRGHIVHPGSRITSLAHFSAEIGLSVQQLRTCFKKLESTGEITRKSTNEYTHITIVKWHEYQSSEVTSTSKATNEQQTDNKRATNDQQLLKNEKNVRMKEEESGALRAPTPSQVAKDFFSEETDHSELIDFFVNKGISEEAIKQELQKFKMYWTEPNKSGTKVRWQMQKTFEIRRRLFTWFNRANQSYSTSPRETKGITI